MLIAPVAVRRSTGFETIDEARYNRALPYRSFVLHSGAIAVDAMLSPSPRSGG